MMKSVILVILLQWFAFCAVAKRMALPSYIKPCSASAPDFEQCCLEHAKAALPFILKGDKKFGIPNMMPLIIPEINTNAGENLKIYLKEVNVFGFEKTALESVKIDLKKQTLVIKIKISELNLIGKYEIDGKILVLPIRGQGDMNIRAFDGEYTYKSDYVLNKVKGEEYFALADKDALDFTVKNINVQLDNLFDGDKKLGDQMNKFLNENWEEVLKEFGPTISETVRSIGRSIASAIFKRVAYRDLLLP